MSLSQLHPVPSVLPNSLSRPFSLLISRHPHSTFLSPLGPRCLLPSLALGMDPAASCSLSSRPHQHLCPLHLSSCGRQLHTDPRPASTLAPRSHPLWPLKNLTLWSSLPSPASSPSPLPNPARQQSGTGCSHPAFKYFRLSTQNKANALTTQKVTCDRSLTSLTSHPSAVLLTHPTPATLALLVLNSSTPSCPSLAGASPSLLPHCQCHLNPSLLLALFYMTAALSAFLLTFPCSFSIVLNPT